MILKNEWFPLSNDKNDIENVLFFLEKLPSKIEHFINPRYSDFYEVLEKNKINIEKELIKQAFKESQIEFRRKFIQFNRDLRIKSIVYKNMKKEKELANDLIKIGFTENSLKLKSITLNKLWEQVLTYLDSIGSPVLKFSDSTFLKLFINFLNYLNSILGSLGVNFGVETLKEFKEIIEGIININENLKLFKS